MPKRMLTSLPLLFLIAMAVVKALVFFYDLIPSSFSFYLTFVGGVGGMCYVFFDFSKNKNTRSLKKSVLIGILIFGSALISVFLQNLLLDDKLDNDSRSPLWFAATTLILAGAYFSIGAALCNAKIRVSNKTSLALIFVLALGIYWGLDGLPVLNFEQMSLRRSDDVRLDHLVLGEPAIFLAALAFAFAGPRFRWAIFGLGLACFFAMGGRTALISYLITAVIFVLLKQKARNVVPAIGLLVVLVLAALAQLAAYGDDPLVARMLLSDGLNADESQIARSQLFIDGLAGLFQQALIGNPNLIVERSGTIGAYSHNALSAWQFFGAFTFFSMLLAIIYASKYIFLNRKYLNSGMDVFGIFIFSYCVVSIFTGKAVNFYPFWLSLGFWLYRIKNDIGRVAPLNVKHTKAVDA